MSVLLHIVDINFIHYKPQSTCMYQEPFWLLWKQQGSYPFSKPDFQTQIDFFQDSKIHINSLTPKISMLILLTVYHTLNFHIFTWVSQISRTFQDQ